MRPVDGELLRLLADMPLLDRLEAVAVSGWSRGAVYRAVRRLEDAGMIASVPHGTELVPSTRRFHLTAAGIRRLARDENAAPEDLLRDSPVSARWRRVLLERLDAVAIIYRLASAISNVTHPIRLRWYRAMPLDAAVALPGGGTVGIVRQGPTTDRTGFSKRLWRLGQGPLPGAVLMLMPDDVRLRHARRLLARTSVAALFALEREAAVVGPDDPVWRLRSVGAAITLRAAIDGLAPGGALAAERPLARTSLPPDIDERSPGGDAPDHLLPALLKPSEKLVLDLLSDWPWLGLGDLAGLLGISRPRASQLTATLEGFGLVARAPVSGRRLALSDTGLAMLARRDRAAVGGARKRWSPAPLDAGDWRNVSGRRSRQLLRHMEHTAAVHGFISTLATQARDLGWEIAQLDPPIRPPVTFGTSGAGGRYTRTPSASSDAMEMHGAFSWSGSGAPCGPSPWRRGSPHTCATTRPTDPPTTTVHGLPSLSSSTKSCGDSLPGRCARPDGPQEDGTSPAGLPQGTAGAGGTAGTGMARVRRRLEAGLPAAAALSYPFRRG